MKRFFAILVLAAVATLFGMTITAGEHAKVGPERCKMCHKVEYNSWVKTAHKKMGVTCETCHGNGGDYWKVMTDKKKAVAAGLIIHPKKELCIKCHGKKFNDSMFEKAHAHTK
ncbi:MAG: hypothetical protein P8018_02970 [Acidobacteriota bacterium]